MFHLSGNRLLSLPGKDHSSTLEGRNQYFNQYFKVELFEFRRNTAVFIMVGEHQTGSKVTTWCLMVCPTSPHLMDMEIVFNHVRQGILWEDDGEGRPLLKLLSSCMTCSQVHFSPVLFITFMDRILDATMGQRGSG